GYVFSSDDPFGGIDLDNCRLIETGEITDWACKFISLLNSYAEISPSGTGIKVIVRGKLPKAIRVRHSTAYRGGKIEMYSDLRFFTITGRHFADTPTRIEKRQTA